ncbi:MAG: hypothetical protein E7314_07195 [Clostridiales bacterium]|nr:hypothetical protein [Clostridiales bacterium]
MDVSKINYKYCTKDKVQITLNNAYNQLICSKDGYLFYKFDDLTLHRYCIERERFSLPNHDPAFSNLHANHLFKFNQPYVFFTPYNTSHVPYSFVDDTYHVRFLYFVKLPNGDVAYLDTTDFDSSNTETKMMTLEELNSFLFDITDVCGKYIIDWNTGVKYAKSKNEILMVDKYPAYCYETILQNYNKFEARRNPSFKPVSNINDVGEHVLTVASLGYNPLLVTISEDKISTYIFKITFCGPDKFKVDLRFGDVTFDENAIAKRAKNLLYSDTFDDYYLFYKRLERIGHKNN